MTAEIQNFNTCRSQKKKAFQRNDMEGGRAKKWLGLGYNKNFWQIVLLAYSTVLASYDCVIHFWPMKLWETSKVGLMLL